MTVGSGMNSDVSALVVSGSYVYAGDRFTTAGGSAANYIAKWDGSSWTAVGSGMKSNVLALAVSGSDLYAGGVFRTASGSTANYIAKWNGNNWTALGSGIDARCGRWRCRAATCMPGACSRRRAAVRPHTLPNGTGHECRQRHR